MTVMSSMNETALAPGTGGLALNSFRIFSEPALQQSGPKLHPCCTLVRLFTWAQWTGELYLIPGRRIGLASFLGLWRARWFYSCWFPLGTCTDSAGAPSRRQGDRHEGHTLDGYVT